MPAVVIFLALAVSLAAVVLRLMKSAFSLARRPWSEAEVLDRVAIHEYSHVFCLMPEPQPWEIEQVKRFYPPR